MLQNMVTQVSAVEEQASSYLARIKQIDKIMEGPVKTLIAIAQAQESNKREAAPNNKICFPIWISPELKPQTEENSLTQALCCGTLQEIWRFRRRFSWLDKDSTQQLEGINDELANAFLPVHPDDFGECARMLKNKTFGGLNPLTAAHIFRVLLEEGEGVAHSGIGFLAFFAMIWPLSRTFPIRLIAGARIEPWDVTAYVTAKCLLPIRRLQGIIERRAKLYDDICRNVLELRTQKDKDNPRAKWLVRIELDDLSANLSHLSRLAIDVKAFRICAKSIRELSDSNDSEPMVYEKVLESLSEALAAVKRTSETVLAGANKIVASLSEQILDPLRVKQGEFDGRKTEAPVTEELRPIASLKAIADELDLRFANEHSSNQEYWKDLVESAKKSIDYCKAALDELKAACSICPGAVTGKEILSINRTTSIVTAFADLANANRRVKDVLNKPVQDAALWCRSVVDREIAHASAENFTDFDPSELVSGIAVAVGWNLMSTKLQVSDAVAKAVQGARKDGSWRAGKPYYSPDHATGIWATTADIVWTLTTAIKQFPTVNEADHELFNFVDWLERTQITLTARSADVAARSGKPDQAGPPSPSDQRLPNYVGWPSERLRDRGKIQLGSTALSINALLEIRNLAEYRLWELCKKRFTVLSADMPLRDIDPVDLGATHPQRLHRKLEQMAYQARVKPQDADYSIVLHGPPGSSKTKLAEALSAEMWKYSSKWGPNEPRLIRITPADFTRMGEDRLDSEARAIFDLLSGVRGVTIFFDEIDDLLRQRNTGNDRPTFMELVVPAMLNRLADLRSACPRQEICFVLATNYVDHIDSALIRKGRIDASIPVLYPDFASRVAISIGKKDKALEKAESAGGKARREEVDKLLGRLLHEEIASNTKGWPYLAFTSLCSFLVDELIRDGAAKFEKILADGLAEHGSSFSPPAYDGRLNGQSQEFLNEYIRHIISQPQSAKDCHVVLADEVKQVKIDASLAFRLRQLLDTILVKEGRQDGNRK